MAGIASETACGWERQADHGSIESVRKFEDTRACLPTLGQSLHSGLSLKREMGSDEMVFVG